MFKMQDCPTSVSQLWCALVANEGGSYTRVRVHIRLVCSVLSPPAELAPHERHEHDARGPELHRHGQHGGCSRGRRELTTCRLLKRRYGYASQPGAIMMIFSSGPSTGCGCVNMTQIE